MGANTDVKNRDGKRPEDLTGHYELELAKSKVLMCYLSVLIKCYAAACYSCEGARAPKAHRRLV